MDKQFKAAELNGIPFGIIIGKDELDQGKVKIKQMGLPEGHPEKEGVLVNLSDIVPEVKRRLETFSKVSETFKSAEGLKVVDGIKGQLEEVQLEDSAASVPEAEKPAEASPLSQEAIGAVPAS